MRPMPLIALSLCLGPLNFTNLHAQGTKVITLSNVTSNCVDVSKNTVDFWLLSARVPKDSNFFQTTRGLGAKVTVTLTDGTNKAPFPVSQAITLTDQSGPDPTVRAYLGIQVLNSYDLWNTSDTTHPVKTTSISLPVSYVRIVGDSAAVQVMNALISFSGSANSALPANPYSQDAQMVGQLVTSLGNIFKNSKDVNDPNYALAFSTNPMGCNEQSLKDGIGAEIAAYSKGKPAQGVISIDDTDNYCFYADSNTDKDPDIVFTNKGNKSCSQDMPLSGYTKLMNPLFVWTVAGTCKTNNGCTQSTNANEVKKVAATINNPTSLQGLLAQRLGDASSQKLAGVIAHPDEEAIRSLNSKEADTIRLLSTCERAGIATEKCLSIKH